MDFSARIFNTLTVRQLRCIDICCAECQSYRSRSTQITGRHLFTPVSKVCHLADFTKFIMAGSQLHENLVHRITLPQVKRGCHGTDINQIHAQLHNV
jgi:hypothetical protein